jgi:replicative DNA helicase
MAEAITVPTLPRLIADDITTEAAASLLAEQGGRLAVLSAEGGIFSTLAGRYSGGVPSLDVFLKGHAGDLLGVDRKGRESEHVEQPALTLGLAVQPDVLRQIARMPGFRGRGLLARILYALPANNVGRRRVGAAAIPTEVQETYDANVKTMVSSLAEWTDPAVLPLEPEAAKLLLDFEADLEPRLDPDAGDLGHLADWASKLVGATVRVAGLLHLAGDLRHGWGQPISADTAISAIQLADYFAAHALAVFDWMGLDPAIDDARAVLDWLGKARPATFTRRGAFTALSRSRFRKVGDLDPALELLEQHGYIRVLPEEPRTGPGRRPSPTYLVNPSLAAETA